MVQLFWMSPKQRNPILRAASVIPAQVKADPSSQTKGNLTPRSCEAKFDLHPLEADQAILL